MTRESIELVAVEHEQAAAGARRMNRVARDLDADEAQARERAQLKTLRIVQVVGVATREPMRHGLRPMHVEPRGIFDRFLATLDPPGSAFSSTSQHAA